MRHVIVKSAGIWCKNSRVKDRNVEKVHRVYATTHLHICSRQQQLLDVGFSLVVLVTGSKLVVQWLARLSSARFTCYDSKLMQMLNTKSQAIKRI